MTTLMTSGQRAAHTSAVAALARFGLAARAFVYLVIGWLAIQIAAGHSTHQANQKGAIADVAGQSYGRALLLVLGAGFAAYAAWRLFEAAFGTAAEGRRAFPRIQSLLRGLVYAALAVTTFAFVTGSPGQSQSQQQQTATARVMRYHDGRWLIGTLGALVVIVGLGMVLEGVTRRFERQLQMNQLRGRTRRVVLRLGVVGTIARGLVFALAGAFVVDAAVTFDPAKSSGLDGALRSLTEHSYGSWLLALLALGLIAFGCYGLAAARWAKT